MSSKDKQDLISDEKVLDLIQSAESAIAQILNEVDLITVINDDKLKKTDSTKSIEKQLNESRERILSLKEFDKNRTSSKKGAKIELNQFQSDQSIEEQLRMSRERIMRLKELSMKLRSGYIQELENIPAYKRKELALYELKNAQVFNNDEIELPREKSKKKDVVSNIQTNSIGVQELSGFNSIKLARQGLPKRTLMELAKRISLTIQEFANILHISPRSLLRYDDEAIIKTEYAEKAIALANLYNRGVEVFGSSDKFKLWLKSPSFIFNGVSPLSVLDTLMGFDMVFKELGRIEHGIFA